MKAIRAAFKIAMFVAATLGLYSIWFLGRPFVSDAIRWRQVIFGSWTKSFVLISNMKIVVIGTPPDPPFFLVTNHLGYTDIAALRVKVTGIFVAMAEINGWFLAGRIVRDLGTIFIDRSNRRDIPRAGEEIIKRLDAGEGVIVFPEGTSTNGSEILPFNSSFFEFAARADIPVSYASISYSVPPGEPPACNSVCWWEEITFFKHLWRFFRLPEYTATLTFGDEPVRNADRKLLAAELRQRILEKFTPVL
ncbi:MAG: lysophospholipid acyltransferase family protein [Pyrinomonadaceae bacterium]